MSYAGRLAATLNLDEPISRVKLVSSSRARALGKLNIHTVRDLLTHYPRRYIDLSHVDTIADAAISSQCSISCTVYEVRIKHPRPKLSLVEISIVDNTGILIITVFRQPWIADKIKPGMSLVVSGRVEFDYGYKRMTNPFIEVLDEKASPYMKIGKIIPLHPANAELSSAWMRRLIHSALQEVLGQFDPLPLSYRRKYRFMSRQAAMYSIHFPASLDERHEARRRLAYEEVLFLELALMVESQNREIGHRPTKHCIDGPSLSRLEEELPFVLTSDQMKAKDEVLHVMSLPHCANHLILGDVGTGKTIIAAFACAAVSDTSTQAFFLAPTEVLAQQHAASIGPLFDKVGITWELLTGSTSRADREAIITRAEGGTLDVLIGTHALLEDDVLLARCSLVIIDEQQRFGVSQRKKLIQKGDSPDVLYLTATPIPRTLALALYGNFTLSYLNERPKTSGQRSTYVLSKTQRGRAYDAALAALSRNEQVYVVCPLVGVSSRDLDERSRNVFGSDTDHESIYYDGVAIDTDEDFSACTVSAAKQEAAFLQAKTFAGWKVELLHGSMHSNEKREVMERFRSGETQVLVTTTVIEVGIDVERATIMIIEDADRFGLAQLHQLRGRVGRGDLASEIYLVSASQSDDALSRLHAMEATEDGFKLASIDLSLRREGDLLGYRQHGASSLSLVNVVKDASIIEAAHQDALDMLLDDPQLKRAEHSALGREVGFILSRSRNKDSQ